MPNLIQVMRAHSDEMIRPENLPSFHDRHVVLPHMKAVGVGQARDIRPIIHDEENSHFGSPPPDFPSTFQEPLIAYMLFSKLDHSGAAGSHFLNDPFDWPCAGRLGYQYTETYVCQLTSSQGTQGDDAFECIALIAEFLETLAQP